MRALYLLSPAPWRGEGIVRIVSLDSHTAEVLWAGHKSAIPARYTTTSWSLADPRGELAHEQS